MNFPATQQQWQQMAAAQQRDTRSVVGGQRVTPLTDQRFESINPHDGSVVASLPACGDADVDRAVTNARQAFASGAWSGMAPSERARILRKFADLIEHHSNELALFDTLEMGMPIGLAAPDMIGAADYVRVIAEFSDKLDDIVLPSATSTLALNVRVPHGVVAAITPWNFPAYVALSKIAPALAVGNALVLKPSEIASLSCLRLAELALEAGVPPCVFNVVTGLGHQAGRALALHQDVDLLTFTGSTITGQQLLQYSGQSNLKPLLLECGGKSPQIIFDDCGDIEALADALVLGFTWNSGQVCVAGTRILIAESLIESLLPLIVQRVTACRMGNPLDPTTTLGPLATRAQLERVSRRMAAALEAGATAFASDSAGPAAASTKTGCYFAPTLFTGVGAEQPLMQEEIFGPVACVLPFRNAAHALALANDTRYGLFATIWTRDFSMAHHFARQLRAGSVTVNAVGQPKPSMISGGAAEPVGMSGYGVEGSGAAGLRSYTRLRGITFNFGHVPSLSLLDLQK